MLLLGLFCVLLCTNTQISSVVDKNVGPYKHIVVFSHLRGAGWL
jgi:hypothetical protein